MILENQFSWVVLYGSFSVSDIMNNIIRTKCISTVYILQEKYESIVQPLLILLQFHERSQTFKFSL